MTISWNWQTQRRKEQLAIAAEADVYVVNQRNGTLFKPHILP
jgi:hypothetical protein